MGATQAEIVKRISEMPVIGLIYPVIILMIFFFIAFNFRDMFTNYVKSLGIKQNKRWQENWVFEFGKYDYLLTKINNFRLYFLRIVDGEVTDITFDRSCTKFLDNDIVCKGKFRKKQK